MKRCKARNGRRSARLLRRSDCGVNLRHQWQQPAWGTIPPFDGAQWLNGTAVVAVKDILRGIRGPRQHRRAAEARNGLLDGFKARLEELESRR